MWAIPGDRQFVDLLQCSPRRVVFVIVTIRLHRWRPSGFLLPSLFLASFCGTAYETPCLCSRPKRSASAPSQGQSEVGLPSSVSETGCLAGRPVCRASPDAVSARRSINRVSRTLRMCYTQIWHLPISPKSSIWVKRQSDRRSVYLRSNILSI